MKLYKIKQEKQSNGLWGTPLNCVKISGMSIDDDKNLFWSAVICLINEHFNRKFEISDYFGKGVYVNLYSDSVSDSFIMNYDRYEVIDDTIYEFSDAQEKIVFLRKNKIKQLNKNEFI
jgi:hypothetical protein